MAPRVSSTCNIDIAPTTNKLKFRNTTIFLIILLSVLSSEAFKLPHSNQATISTIPTMNNTSNQDLSISKAIEFEDSSSSASTCTDDASYIQDLTVVEPHVGYKKVLVTGMYLPSTSSFGTHHFSKPSYHSFIHTCSSLSLGGAGFIGSHVAEYLLARGDDVVIIDEVNDYYDTSIKETNLSLLRKKYTPDRVSIYRGDICDEELMTEIFEKEKPEWVCHLAARAGVRPSIQDPFVYIHSNIKGTTMLMELSHRYGVKNFVFASSSSVYGGSKSTFFSEEEVVDNPVSPYAATKKACELLAYTYHHLYNLNVSGLRFFTVYGDRGRPDMAPFKFIDRVSRGLEIQQFGDGSSSRDYTYISDIVDGVVRSIDRPYPYEIFNLGKGNGTSLKEFIGLVQKHTGKKATINVLPNQPGDVPYTCADVRKASKLLGYHAKVSFEEGIRRTVKWYKSANEKDELQLCPERQANGLDRSPSFVVVSQ